MADPTPAPSSGGSPPREDDAWPLDDQLHEVMVGIGLGEPGPTIEEKLRALAEAVITLDEATAALRALVGAGDEPEPNRMTLPAPCMWCGTPHADGDCPENEPPADLSGSPEEVDEHPDRHAPILQAGCNVCVCGRVVDDPVHLPAAPVQRTPEGDAATELDTKRRLDEMASMVNKIAQRTTLSGGDEAAVGAEAVRVDGSSVPSSESEPIPSGVPEAHIVDRSIDDGSKERVLRGALSDDHSTGITPGQRSAILRRPSRPPAAGTTPPAANGDQVKRFEGNAPPPAVPPPGDAATERLAQMREDAAVERATRLEEALEGLRAWAQSRTGTAYDPGVRAVNRGWAQRIDALLSSAAPTPTEGDSADG